MEHKLMPGFCPCTTDTHSFNLTTSGEGLMSKGCCKTWTLDSGLDWTGLDWTGLDRDFDDHFLLTCNS